MRERSSNSIAGGPVLVIADEERAGAILKWDASGSMEDRTQFDGARKDFAYLVIDPLPFTMYIKRSLAVGDWSSGQVIKASPAQSVEEATAAAQAASAERIRSETAAAQSVASASSAAAVVPTVNSARDEATNKAAAAASSADEAGRLVTLISSASYDAGTLTGPETPRFARRMVRATSAQNQAYTGPSGELVYDTESKQVYSHDGNKPGGNQLARSKFRQVGSDIDTDLADAARQTLTPSQYVAGVNGGAIRAEATILQAFREARVTGRRLDLLAGTYLTSGLEFDWRGLTGDFTVDRRGVPIRGEGSQNTIIKSAVSGQFAISHIGPRLVHSGMSDLSIVGVLPTNEDGEVEEGAVSEANGIDLFGLGYFSLSGINLGKLKTAMRVESVLSGTFDKVMISEVETGVDIQSPTKPGAFTDFNMMRWNSAHFKQCRKWAMNGGPSTTIPMWAPVIEGNGTMARGPNGEAIDDPTNDTGGLKLTFTGGNGSTGLLMLGPYIEANLGKCDIELINTSDREITHVLILPYFGRLDGGSFTKHNLILTGKHKVVIIGGVHEHHHNYVPDATRSYIKYDKTQSRVINIGTTWESALEKGDLFNIEDVVDELRVRSRAQSYMGNSGQTSIPGGVTRYITPGMVGVNAFDVYAPVGRRVRVRGLRVYTLEAPGAGQSYTFTVMKIATATAIACTISGTASNTSTDDVNSEIFEPSDRLCVRVTTTAGAAPVASANFSLIFDPLD